MFMGGLRGGGWVEHRTLGLMQTGPDPLNFQPLQIIKI